MSAIKLLRVFSAVGFLSYGEGALRTMLQAGRREFLLDQPAGFRLRPIGIAAMSILFLASSGALFGWRMERHLG